MSGLRRRSLLRALLGVPVAGALAGCNDSGDGGDDPDAGPAEPTGTPSAGPSPGSPAPTAPPADPAATPSTPTVTVSPTVTRRPSPTATPSTQTAPATATPSTPTRSPTPTPDSQARTAREFVARLAAGEFAGAHELLIGDYAAELTPAKLERYWLGLTAQHGPFERVTGIERGRRDGFETAVVVVACAQGTGRVEVAALDGRVDGLWFPASYSPPAYADRSAFTERAVTVDAPGCSLPATLAVPTDGGTATDSDGGRPGAVLVHGSGRSDRDGTVGPNEPLRDLAWGLASRGVVVLRYEKRTYRCDVPLAEWDIDGVVVDDALRALARLREAPAVDPDRTVVVGHSLGGTCTPRVLARDRDAAGGAMLAANARPITTVSLDQVRHFFEIPDGVSVLEGRRIDRLRTAFDRLEAGDYAPDRVIEGFPASWWTSLLDYDQVATAAAVDAPLLLAQGGRDFQVLADADFARWRSELADRDRTRFERYPHLSHLFHPGTAPSLREEYVFHDNVAAGLVADLTEWITGVDG